MTITTRLGWVLLPLLLLMPLSVSAERIEGQLNGLVCASKGKTCPTDKEDPHVLLEPDFVVQMEDGNYVYITNMDWGRKLKYVLQKVRVEGIFSDQSSVITADEFWVKEADGYQLKWSLKMAREKQLAEHQLENQPPLQQP